MKDRFWSHRVAWFRSQLCFRTFSVSPLSLCVAAFLRACYSPLQKRTTEWMRTHHSRSASLTWSSCRGRGIVAIIGCTHLHLGSEITWGERCTFAARFAAAGLLRVTLLPTSQWGVTHHPVWTLCLTLMYSTYWIALRFSPSVSVEHLPAPTCPTWIEWGAW